MCFRLLWERKTKKECGLGKREDAPNGAMELEEVGKLNKLMVQVNLTNNRDRWVWRGDELNGFAVKKMRELLIKEKDYGDRLVFKWVKWVPKKCNIFVWRAVIDRVPTLVALNSRNCYWGSLVCGLCDDGTESFEHLLCYCRVTSTVWNLVCNWCRVPQVFFMDIKDIVKTHKFVGAGKEKRKVIKGIVWTTCWCIWMARNDRKFKGVEYSPGKIFHNVKSLGFLWFSNRTSRKGIGWKDWINFDFM